MPEDQTFIDRVKDASLHNAGLGYLIGDGALVAHGLINGNKNRALTGLLWGVGGAGLAAFGKKPSAYQLKELSLNLAEDLRNNNIAIPTDSTLHQKYVQNSNALYDRTERFLFNHPTQILNSVYAIGAAFLMRSGLKSGPNHNTRDWGEFSSGVLVMAGALAGLLIPEGTPKKPSAETASTTHTLQDWVKEKPLRISGILYTLNNFPMLYSGYEEHKTGSVKQNSHMLKYLAGVAFLSSNVLLGLSNKDRTQDFDSEQLKLLSSYAAEIVASQPKEIRDEALQTVAAHMAKEPALQISKEEALAHLNHSITNARQPSPTVSHVTEQALVNAPHPTHHFA